jgi:hypothetical protein
MFLFLITKHTQQTMSDIIDTAATDKTNTRSRDRDSPAMPDKFVATLFYTVIHHPKVAYFLDEQERDLAYDQCIKETECFDKGEGTQSVRSTMFEKGRAVLNRNSVLEGELFGELLDVEKQRRKVDTICNDVMSEYRKDKTVHTIDIWCAGRQYTLRVTQREKAFIMSLYAKGVLAAKGLDATVNLVSGSLEHMSFNALKEYARGGSSQQDLEHLIDTIAKDAACTIGTACDCTAPPTAQDKTEDE